MRRLFPGVCFLVFVGVGLGVAHKSISYYWNWDDLHLVRTFSAEELASVFSGHWDPDKLETAGFRPLTTVFNHARAWLFGESTLAHRLFLIALYAVYLTLLGVIARRFGISRYAALLAGVLVLSAQNSMYHFVWISDGIHILQGVLFAAAVLLSMRYVEHGKTFHFAASLALAALSLLVREDSLGTYPVILALFIAYALNEEKLNHVHRSILVYAGVLAAAFVIFWWWRDLVIPQAAGLHFDGSSFRALLRGARWTICPAGAGMTCNVFLMGFGALLAVTLFLFEKPYRNKCLLWLACTALALLPGLVMERVNLLFFPASFYAVFVAAVVVEFAKLSRLAWICAGLFIVFTVATSVRSSIIAQESVHPMSSGQIKRDWSFLYGNYAFASVPDVRIAYLERKLTQLGIGPQFDFCKWIYELEQKGRIGLRRDNEPFLPRHAFLSP